MTELIQTESWVKHNLEVFDELFVLVIASIFFTILYELDISREYTGTVAFGAWLFLGFVWILESAAAGLSTWIVGLIFHGIAIIYILRVVIERLEMKTLSRSIDE